MTDSSLYERLCEVAAKAEALSIALFEAAPGCGIPEDAEWIARVTKGAADKCLSLAAKMRAEKLNEPGAPMYLRAMVCDWASELDGPIDNHHPEALAKAAK